MTFNGSWRYDEYKKKKRDERIEKARGMRQPIKRKVKVSIFQLHSNEKVVPHSASLQHDTSRSLSQYLVSFVRVVQKKKSLVSFATDVAVVPKVAKFLLLSPSLALSTRRSMQP